MANDAFSSTVIFVGAGPLSNSMGLSNSIVSPIIVAAALTSNSGPPLSISTSSLYVASTYQPVNAGPRDALDVPAVSSLSLDPNKLFEFTSQSISSGTFMKLDYRRLPLFK